MSPENLQEHEQRESWGSAVWRHPGYVTVCRVRKRRRENRLVCKGLEQGRLYRRDKASKILQEICKEYEVCENRRQEKTAAINDSIKNKIKLKLFDNLKTRLIKSITKLYRIVCFYNKLTFFKDITFLVESAWNSFIIFTACSALWISGSVPSGCVLTLTGHKRFMYSLPSGPGQTWNKYLKW